MKINIKPLVIFIYFVLILVFTLLYVLIFNYNKNNNYLNDFRYIKTTYYENNKINKKIKELVTNKSLVSNNVLDNKYVNLLAYEDGQYKSYIYQYYNGREVTIKDLFKNQKGYELFSSKVNDMCLLKYPSIACDELMKNANASYEILPNEIIVYFNKTELLKDTMDDYFVEINYRELIIDNNNILNYSFILDNDYENPNIYTLNPNKKTIAFTFDDGPSENSNTIVDALNKYHYKATFFVVGNRLSKFSSNLKYEYQNGMEIGSHSYDHSNLAKLKNGKLESNINNNADVIEKVVGQRPFLIRPPYGAINDYVKHSLDNAFILWSVDTNDWLYKDKNHIVNHILENAKDGDIILMHDLYDFTKEAVLEVLPELYLRGYQVVSVSELAEIKGIKLESHKAYRSIK